MLLYRFFPSFPCQCRCFLRQHTPFCRWFAYAIECLVRWEDFANNIWRTEASSWETSSKGWFHASSVIFIWVTTQPKISITWFWKLMDIDKLYGVCGIDKPLVWITLRYKFVWNLTALKFALDCGIHCGATKNWKWSHWNGVGQLENHWKNPWSVLWVSFYIFEMVNWWINRWMKLVSRNNHSPFEVADPVIACYLTMHDSDVLTDVGTRTITPCIIM